MNIAEYTEISQKISTFSDWQDKVFYGAIGLSTESGEVLDNIKKWRERKKTLNLDDIEEELGDCLWYLIEFATGMEFCLKSIFKLANTRAKRYENLKQETKEMDELELLMTSISLNICGATILNIISEVNLKSLIRGEDFKGQVMEELLGIERRQILELTINYLTNILLVAQKNNLELENILNQNIKKLQYRYPKLKNKYV